MSSPNNTDAVVDRGESSSPRASNPLSLQAAATMNAGLEASRRSSSSSLARNRHSPLSSSRRRSQVLMNLQFNDPAVPAPGEMVNEPHVNGYRSGSPQPISQSPQPLAHSPSLLARDPHHNRTPSLGELHQELEAEQEAQVNRLLVMIRQQQVQLQHLQANQQSQAQTTETAVVDSSDRSLPTSTLPFLPAASAAPQAAIPIPAPHPRSPSFPHHPRSSFDMARADLQRRSRTPSRGASPRLRATSISGDSGEQWVLGSRDESAFYQAETQMLVRENQMLRHRVRDLEKQLADLTPNSPALTHEPSIPSHLTHSTSASEEESSGARARPSHSEPLPTVEDTPKEE